MYVVRELVEPLCDTYIYIYEYDYIYRHYNYALIVWKKQVLQAKATHVCAR